MRTAVKTSMSSVAGLMDESEKEKRSQINDEEEINKLSNQIRILAEERKKLWKGRGKKIGKPRIISDVQIAPPRGVIQDTVEREGQQEEEWTDVTNRRRNVNRRMVRGRIEMDRSERFRNGVRLRRPRTAVVAIRAKNKNVSYAEVLKKARQEVSLGDIGIEVTRIKRGINGSLLIEIPGQEGNEKAKALADKLRDKLGESEMSISRQPQRN